MGFVSDFVDDFTGKTAEQAARQSAQQQVDAAGRALDVTGEARDTARGDLQPFTAAGTAGLDPLQSLILDPNAQRDFVQNNPFFDALLSEERQNTLQNQAARGKLGSGGTLKALDENVLRIGQGLVDNQTNKLQNLVGIGQNAATNQAGITQNFGQQASNLLTGQGAAQAAGTVGAANARVAGAQNIVNLVTDAAKLFAPVPKPPGTSM